VAHAARLEGVQAKQLRCKRLFTNLGNCSFRLCLQS